MVGCLVPAFYDWSGADQSRSPPVIGFTALGLLAAGAVLCLLLPWLPIAEKADDQAVKFQGRFSIRLLVILTSALALWLALLMQFPLPISVLGYVVILGLVIWFGIRSPQFRWHSAAFLATLYLPFTWIASKGLLFASLAAAGLPGLLPTLFLGVFSGNSSLNHSQWLPLLLTSCFLMVGFFVIRLGSRPTIALLVVTLLASTFGSFVLNALIRM